MINAALVGCEIASLLPEMRLLPTPKAERDFII